MNSSLESSEASSDRALHMEKAVLLAQSYFSHVGWAKRAIKEDEVTSRHEFIIVSDAKAEDAGVQYLKELRARYKGINHDSNKETSPDGGEEQSSAKRERRWEKVNLPGFALHIAHVQSSLFAFALTYFSNHRLAILMGIVATHYGLQMDPKGLFCPIYADANEVNQWSKQIDPENSKKIAALDDGLDNGPTLLGQVCLTQSFNVMANYLGWAMPMQVAPHQFFETREAAYRFIRTGRHYQDDYFLAPALTNFPDGTVSVGTKYVLDDFCRWLTKQGQQQQQQPPAAKAEPLSPSPSLDTRTAIARFKVQRDALLAIAVNMFHKRAEVVLNMPTLREVTQLPDPALAQFLNHWKRSKSTYRVRSDGAAGRTGRSGKDDITRAYDLACLPSCNVGKEGLHDQTGLELPLLRDTWRLLEGWERYALDREEDADAIALDIEMSWQAYRARRRSSEKVSKSTSQSGESVPASPHVAQKPMIANGHGNDPSAASVNLSEYDLEQVRLMEERCIVVNWDDQVVGEGSKKECHLMENIHRGLLHRAFSAFVFDPEGRLLLQCRSSEKITFPKLWTNTCCSHPLYIQSELGDPEKGESATLGVKRAARRKLEHELGIPQDQIPLDAFKYLTKIHYLAPSDGLWGEHEIDHILFWTSAKVNLEPNMNEVCDVRWVTKEEMQAMFSDSSYAFTPWFRLICNRFLFGWWDHLSDLDSLSDNLIHRMLPETTKNKDFAPLKNDLLLRAARNEMLERSPVWVMRQAGRYLPEFRALREKHGFFEVCQTPTLAAEITMQPIRRYRGLLDAAIIFSDILVIPQALGLQVVMLPEKGPHFPAPLIDPTHLTRLKKRLNVRTVKELSSVYEAITLVRKELAGEVPLIGFVGAPWTLFAYMVEGGGSKFFARAKQWIFSYTKESLDVLNIITRVTIDHLVEQVRAGAQLLQVFDSWAGELSPQDFAKFSYPFLCQIATEVKAKLAIEKLPVVPMTVFAKGAHYALDDLAQSSYDVIGLDWTMDATSARAIIRDRKAVQGNLDPGVLYASVDSIKRETTAMSRRFASSVGLRGHITNLGHGITPGVDPEHLRVFLECVHTSSREVAQVSKA